MQAAMTNKYAYKLYVEPAVPSKECCVPVLKVIQ